jgi:hypothetical protein
MSEMKSDRRYALATCLIKIQLARRLDDLGDILVKRMQAIHTKASEALAEWGCNPKPAEFVQLAKRVDSTVISPVVTLHDICSTFLRDNCYIARYLHALQMYGSQKS